MIWQPIATAPKDKHLLLCHETDRWLRFGKFYSNVGRWYYSGTNERSQYGQVEGDAPTHWTDMPDLPPRPPTPTRFAQGGFGV